MQVLKYESPKENLKPSRFLAWSFISEIKASDDNSEVIITTVIVATFVYLVFIMRQIICQVLNKTITHIFR